VVFGNKRYTFDKKTCEILVPILLSAGADCSKIVYAGVGKTNAEITEALNARIGYFNIESEAELENLISIYNMKYQI